MIRFLWVLAAAFVALAPASARDLVIDPAAAYVVVEVRHLEDAVLKGSKVPGTLSLARYDPVKGDVRGGELSLETALPKGQAVRLAVQSKPVAKTKTGRLYVIELEPDAWVIEGASGTAFSLGSMMFRIEPGQIVDLGVFKPSVDWVEGEGPKGMGAGLLGAALFGSVGPKEQRPIRIEWRARTAEDIALPAALAGRTVLPVEFTPGQKFGNYLGGLVNRFDGRAGRTAPTPVGVAQ